MAIIKLPTTKNGFVMRIKKAKDQVIDREFLKERSGILRKRGYSIPKWIQFCDEMIAQKFTIILTEHNKSLAKYLTVSHKDQAVKLRFASEADNTHQQLDAQCELLVGGKKSNSNTYIAIKSVVDKLNGEYR